MYLHTSRPEKRILLQGEGPALSAMRDREHELGTGLPKANIWTCLLILVVVGVLMGVTVEFVRCLHEKSRFGTHDILAYRQHPGRPSRWHSISVRIDLPSRWAANRLIIHVPQMVRRLPTSTPLCQCRRGNRLPTSYSTVHTSCAQNWWTAPSRAACARSFH